MTRPSPATQMRVMLVASRRSSIPFEIAWTKAYARVRWPHDTTHRRDWKITIDWARTEYEDAYNGTGNGKRGLRAVYALMPAEGIDQLQRVA